MIQTGEEPIGVVCGGSKSGKTSLAIAIGRALRRDHGLRVLVFDPYHYKNNWGPWAWVTGDLARFRAAVAGSSGCGVIWDESTLTLAAGTDDAESFFTAIRHRHRAFFLVTHDVKKLSPTMRGSIDHAYVFRQTDERARDWSGIFADSELRQASQLNQYEFLVKKSFRPVVRMSPSKEELRAFRL